MSNWEQVKKDNEKIAKVIRKYIKENNGKFEFHGHMKDEIEELDYRIDEGWIELGTFLRYLMNNHAQV